MFNNNRDDFAPRSGVICAASSTTPGSPPPAASSRRRSPRRSSRRLDSRDARALRHPRAECARRRVRAGGRGAAARSSAGRRPTEACGPCTGTTRSWCSGGAAPGPGRPLRVARARGGVPEGGHGRAGTRLRRLPRRSDARPGGRRGSASRRDAESGGSTSRSPPRARTTRCSARCRSARPCSSGTTTFDVVRLAGPGSPGARPAGRRSGSRNPPGISSTPR